MTEVEWLAATDPEWMLDFLRGRTTDRKMRLFGCACCRLIWHLLPDDSCKTAVETAERFADGFATEEEWRAACRAAEPAIVAASTDANMDAADAATDAAGDIRNAAIAAAWASVSGSADGPAAFSIQRSIQCHLLRDIFGNPFRPVAFDPDWRTSTVAALATGVYADRTFDRLPILADALQDAGCDSDDLLTHLRGDGPHVKGCWALDLVLGKE